MKISPEIYFVGAKFNPFGLLPLVMAGAGEEQCPLLDNPCSLPSLQAASCPPLPPLRSVQSRCCHCGWSHRCCRRCCRSLMKPLLARLVGAGGIRHQKMGQMKLHNLISSWHSWICLSKMKLQCCVCGNNALLWNCIYLTLWYKLCQWFNAVRCYSTECTVYCRCIYCLWGGAQSQAASVVWC